MLADNDPQLSIEMIATFLSAKNAVAVCLGGELAANEKFATFLKGISSHIEVFSEEQLESLVSQNQGGFDFVYHIGDEETQRKAIKIAELSDAFTTGVVKSSNVAVVTDGCEDLNRAVHQIFSNKIELGGRKGESISTVFVHESIRNIFVNKLSILIDSYYSKKHGEDFVGKIHSSKRNEILSALTRVAPSERLNSSGIDLQTGVMKMALISTPSDLDVQSNLQDCPALIIHTFKEQDALVDKINTIPNLGSVSYFGSERGGIVSEIISALKGAPTKPSLEDLARKLNC